MTVFEKSEKVFESENLLNFNNSMGESGLRTYFIFLDIPVHLEILAGKLQILPEKLEVEFDIEVRDPNNPKRTKKVEGLYFIKRRMLRWSNSRPSRSGLIQYIEWSKATSS